MDPAGREGMMVRGGPRDPEREARIIVAYPTSTLAEIAATEGLSPPRVSRIIAAYERRTGHVIPRRKRGKARGSGNARPTTVRPTVAQRLLRLCVLVPETGCWSVRTSVSRDRAGYVFFQGVAERQAHRVAWRLWRGAVPRQGSGWVLSPTCGDRACVNPYHWVRRRHTTKPLAPDSARRALARASTPVVKGVAMDAWGDEWTVEEERLTTHGWPLLMGRPRLAGGGRIRQGKTTILTPELAAHLRDAAERQRPYEVDLPVNRGVVKRLRRLLGLSWHDARRAWWEERSDDLADLTLAQFALRHGVSEAAASLAHKATFGPRLRPAGWWRHGRAALYLASDLPRAYVAHRLGLSVGAVGRLRWILRSERNRTA